jgi:peptide/nickel transport system substrate-binding protein
MEARKKTPVSSTRGFTPCKYESFLSLLQVFGIILSPLLTGCTVKNKTEPGNQKTLTILLDRPPITLNPRKSLDAAGQRFGEMLFRGLVRKDTQLAPQPDLASRWENHELEWKFFLRPDAKDQDGKPITPEDMRTCLENYRNGSPLFASSIPAWQSTTADSESVTLHLKSPEPYLLQNLTIFRFFRVGSRPACDEPKPGDRIVGSGPYRAESLRFEDLSPESDLTLIPVEGDAPRLHFTFGADDNSKALRIVRGEVDAAFDGLSLAKTRWIEKNFGDRFHLLAHPGVSVSYLNFNVREKPLSNVLVRRAIAQAIDRDDIVDHKLFGYGQVATSLIHPMLAESGAFPPPGFDPEAANRLLDQAGYPRGADGVRMRLKYKATPVRDGYEVALIFREMLERVGIELEIEVVEPAVFFASIRKGGFQMYSSRWVGISDGSILDRTLKSSSLDNRGGYKNPEMDALLESAHLQKDPAKRIEILKLVQKKVAEDLPFIPLWYWKNAYILKSGVTGLADADLSLNGSFMPLSKLR